MRPRMVLDALVRESLRTWPQRPPGIRETKTGRNSWLRGRPGDEYGMCHPYLKFPGSDRMRTLPDGLWLHFNGTPEEPFVDILAIEACSTLPNLLDKRSRFAPSTQSLVAVCPVPWLLAPVQPGDPTPRWKVTGVFRYAPSQALIMPIRDIRVLYGLKMNHYEGFAATQTPHPHEYFVPMERLITEDSASDPKLRGLLARADARSNFLDEEDPEIIPDKVPIPPLRKSPPPVRRPVPMWTFPETFSAPGTPARVSAS